MADEQTNGKTAEELNEQMDAAATLDQALQNWKILGEISTSDGIGVLGHNTSSTGQTSGVKGVVDSDDDFAVGVRGVANGSGKNYGVLGNSDSGDGCGLGTFDDAYV